jgi:hypothetical protein
MKTNAKNIFVYDTSLWQWLKIRIMKRWTRLTSVQLDTIIQNNRMASDVTSIHPSIKEMNAFFERSLT